MSSLFEIVPTLTAASPNTQGSVVTSESYDPQMVKSRQDMNFAFTLTLILAIIIGARLLNFKF